MFAKNHISKLFSNELSEYSVYAGAPLIRKWVKIGLDTFDNRWLYLEKDNSFL